MTDVGLSVSIKFGPKYQESLVNFKGLPSEIRDQLVAYFGLTPEQVEGKSLHQIHVACAAIAHGEPDTAVGVIQAAFPGSQVVSDEPRGGQADPVDDPWAQAKATQAPAAQPEPPKDPIVQAIEAAASKADLQAIYVRHNAELKRPEIQAAFNAARTRLGLG